MTSSTASSSSFLHFNNSTFPSAAVGQLYTVAVNASGGASPYTYSLSSGSLPTGLSLSSTTGTIAGRVGAGTGGQTFSFVISITDSANSVLTQNYSIAVATVPSITTASLPSAVVGASYNTTLATTGGIAPMVIALSSGTLPSGMSFNGSTGAITGTPAIGTPGSSPASLTFTVTDSIGQTANSVLTLNIVSQLHFLGSLILPTGSISTTYRYTAPVYGGKPPYTWALPGSPPGWMSINSSTGVISGTPNAAATSSVPVQVTDAYGNSITSTFSITVNATALTTLFGTGRLSSACFSGNCYARGVALADFNGDGKLDAISTGWNDGTLNVAFGDGSGGQTISTSYASGQSNPFQMATGDFDGDGATDVVHTNYSSNTISIWRNQGAGTFSTSAGQLLTLSTGSTPWGVFVADVNGDGKKDIIVANYNSNSVSVFINNSTSGSLSFAAGVTYGSGGANPKFLTLKDMNGDGCPDIVVTNWNQGNQIDVLLGNKAGTCLGTFATAVGYNIPGQSNPVGIVGADFNNDGYQDVAVSWNSGAVSVILGNGNGTLNTAGASTYTLSGISQNFNLLVGDLDGDGYPDLVVDRTNSSLMTVMLNTSHTGNFSGTQTTYGRSSGDNGTLALGKMYGGTNPDLVMMNYAGTQEGDATTVFKNNGSGSYYAPSVIYSGIGNSFLNTTAVLAADFTGDGVADIGVVNYSNGTVSCLKGAGNGTFLQTSGLYSMGGGGSPGYWYTHPVAVVGDFNGDGTPDIAVTNYTASTIGVMLNTSSGNTCSFGATATYTTSGLNPMGIAAGDLNQDGFTDLVATTWTGNTVEIFYNKGDGTFNNVVSYPTGGSTGDGVAIGDINNDGLLDIVVSNWNSNNITVLTRNVNGTYNAPLLYSVSGSQPSGIALADLRRTGWKDVITANYNSGTVSVLLNTGTGVAPYYSGATTYGVSGGNVSQLVVVDINGDGIPDIVVNNNNAYGISYLQGNGDGTFKAAVKYTTFGSNPSGLAWGYLNADNSPDLIFGNWGTGLLGSILNFSF